MQVLFYELISDNLSSLPQEKEKGWEEFPEQKRVDKNPVILPPGLELPTRQF